MSNVIKIHVVSNNNTNIPNIESAQSINLLGPIKTNLAYVGQDVSQSVSDLKFGNWQMTFNYYQPLSMYTKPAQYVAISTTQFFESIEEASKASNGDTDYLFYKIPKTLPFEKTTYTPDCSNIKTELNNKAHLFYNQDNNNAYICDPFYITVFDPIDLEAEPEIKTSAIKFYGSNYTCDKTELIINENNTLTLTANNDYKIKSYKIFQTTVNGEDVELKQEIGLNVDNVSITVTPVLDDDTYIVVTTEKNETPTPEPEKITLSIPDNVSTNLSTNILTYGDKISNLIFYANDDYEFDNNEDILGLSFNGISLGESQLSSNKKQFIQQNIDTSILTENEFKQLVIVLPVHKIDNSDNNTKNIPLKLNLVNCSCNYTELPENTTTLITLTADDNCSFKQNVVYSFWDVNYLQYIEVYEPKTNNNEISFTLKTGPYSDYKENVNGYFPYINATATKNEAISQGTKQLHLYKVSDEELNDLSKTVIKNITNTESSTYDYTRFIQSLYRIPINIPSELLENSNGIFVGDTKIKLSTASINQDNFKLDLGSITVEPHYNNSNDYQPVSVTMNLPFIKEITLNINSVMNHTLKIEYYVDLLSGIVTANIYNENNDVVYSNQFNISTSLTIYSLSEDKALNRINSTFINKIKTAYLTIIYKKPILNLTSYSTNEYGKLGDYKGFTRVSKGTLIGNHTLYEENDILNKLKQGVVIHDVESY